MIKLPVNAKLSIGLDKVITGYTSPGKLVGEPNDNPTINEVDLVEIMKKGDVTVAPNVHCYFIEGYDANHIAPFAQDLFPNNKLISASGRFHYPPKGYMGWHTNSNMEGWRVYATRSEEDNKSFFRYYDIYKREIITEWEKKGWNFRAFQVKKGNPYWHCVYSDTDRYSFGFRFV